MKIHFEKDLPVLLFILVCTSTLASLPQVESAWAGVKEVYGEQDFGLRILREAMLAVVVAYAFFEPRIRRAALTSPVLAFLGVISTYVLFEVGYAAYIDLPLVVPLAGLRVFEYLPVALIGFVISRLDAGETVTFKFARYLRYYLALQAVLAIAQALWAPPLFGVSFLGGGRPFGTFVSPNLFGATMSTCALLFSIVPGMRKWLALSVFLALLSGSRTAFISSLLVVFFQLYTALRPRDRWALVMPAPILAVGALILASSPLLSGRDDANPTEDGRIDLWQRIFSEHIHDPVDLVFGWGLGLSSNTINVLYGDDHFQGQFDSDSLYLFLLNGYGLLGLIAYLSFLWATTRMSVHPNKG
ncbi:MAG: O-antigen ligase family protein, partial [Pyrinomonadaceae bacterium]